MDKISTIISIQPLGDLVLITLKDGAQVAIPPSELYHGQLREHDMVLYSTDYIVQPLRKIIDNV